MKHNEETLNDLLWEFISELFSEEDDDIDILDEDDVERITKMVVYSIYDYCSKKIKGKGNPPKYSLDLDKSLDEIIRECRMKNAKDFEKLFKSGKFKDIVVVDDDDDDNSEKLPPNLQKLLDRKKEEEDDDDKIKFLSFLGNNSDDDDETINFTISKEQTDSIEIPCPYCNTIKNIGYIKFSESPYYNTECSKCNKEYIVHLDFDPKTKIFIEK